MQKRKSEQHKIQPQEKRRILTLDVLLLHVYVSDLLLHKKLQTNKKDISHRWGLKFQGRKLISTPPDQHSIRSRNLHQVMEFDVMPRDLYCESRVNKYLFLHLVTPDARGSSYAVSGFG